MVRQGKFELGSAIRFHVYRDDHRTTIPFGKQTLGNQRKPSIAKRNLKLARACRTGKNGSSKR